MRFSIRRGGATVAYFLLTASAWGQAIPPESAFRYDVRRPDGGGTESAEKRAALVERLSGVADSSGRPVRYAFTASGEIKTLLSLEAALSEPSDSDPEAVARDYLAANAVLFSLQPTDVETLELTATSSAGDLAVLTFQQHLEGLPVWGGFVRVAIDAEGRVRQVERGQLISGGALETAAGVSAGAAATLAYASLGEDVAGEGVELAPSPTGRRRFVNPADPSAEPSLVEAVVFPRSPALGVLAWRVFLVAEAGEFEMLLSAADGSLMLREGRTEEAGAARVWTNSPAAGEREVLPFGDGWIPDGGTITSGDYVDAFIDQDGDDEPDPRNDDEFSDGRAFDDSQNFDFDAGDGFGAPFDAQAAAVANAFYFTNVARDLFYALGFRERDGDFQVDNGDLGGVGGDPVKVHVQSGASANNASFLTRPEGEPARMRVGVFRYQDGFRDGAFDGDLMIHEYAHGVTNRLIGGPDQVGCLAQGPQPDALGEAWSDYFPASYYGDPVVGEYIGNNPDRGIRRDAYDQNPRTYADLGLGGTATRPPFEPHDDGEVFAAALWEIHEALGREAADQIILNGIKLTPCNPTFLDARDAILLAAGLPRRETLWRIFAGRGMGYSAGAQNTSAALYSVFNASFDLPPDLDESGNQPPLVVSQPGEHAVYGELFVYQIRALDLDGDELRYELVDYPEGTLLERSTGLLRWPAPGFTSARFQVRVTDGRGGETLHGFFLYADAHVQLGQTIVVDSRARLNGFAYFDVPPGTPALQIRMRPTGETEGDDLGAALLSLYGPDLRLAHGVVADELTGTLTIDRPRPGEWLLVTGALTEYRNAALTFEATAAADLELDEPMRGLSGDETSETFFRIVVPEGAERLRVVSTAGAGDVDLWMAQGEIPTCQFPVGAICTAELFSERSGNVETIDLENPPPGEWFVTLFGYAPYAGLTLRASTSASAITLTSAADAAAGRERLAPLGLASLYGEGLAAETAVAAGAPLPATLGGVRVYVNGLRAALLMTSPGQINFQTPRETLLDIPFSGAGQAEIEVATDDDVATGLIVPLALNAPALFQVPSGDGTVATITHLDGSLVTPENPAAPGERLVAYLTGLGFVRNAPPTGTASRTAPLAVSVFPVEATVGDEAAEVGFAGLTPGFVGLAQIDFVVPAEASGTLELVFTIDAESSPPVEMYVAESAP